jgi:hypothetical protein
MRGFLGSMARSRLPRGQEPLADQDAFKKSWFIRLITSKRIGTYRFAPAEIGTVAEAFPISLGDHANRSLV